MMNPISLHTVPKIIRTVGSKLILYNGWIKCKGVRKSYVLYTNQSHGHILLHLLQQWQARFLCEDLEYFLGTVWSIIPPVTLAFRFTSTYRLQLSISFLSHWLICLSLLHSIHSCHSSSCKRLCFTLSCFKIYEYIYIYIYIYIPYIYLTISRS